jgi:uncharacterized protein
MAEHPNVETLTRGYEAFGKGDMETLRSELFRPDIAWHQGGNNPTAGDYRGSNKKMADALRISPKTVGRHIENIYGQTGVSTRASATVFALQQGIVN